jgi:hypothetical protein
MGEIDKPNPEEIVSLLTAFADINLAAALFEQQGWTFTEEIRELTYVAKQSLNLNAKLTAIKMLRQIVKDTMEASGAIGNISKRIKEEDGSETVFSAKHIARALNPKKQIISQEISNDETEREQKTEVNTGSPGGQCGKRNIGTDDGRRSGNSYNEDNKGGSGHIGTDDAGGDTDRGDVGRCDGDAAGNASDGKSASADKETISYSGKPPETGNPGGDDSEPAGTDDYIEPPREGDTDNACIQHRPPTCRRDLYPGISGPTPTGQ